MTAEQGTGNLDGYVVRYTGQETDENIAYTLYRATLSASKTELVYEKVADVSAAPHENKQSVTTYTWNETTSSAEPHTGDVNSTIDYTFTDKDLDTGASYSYIVVASKASAKDEISNSVSVRGAN